MKRLILSNLEISHTGSAPGLGTPPLKQKATLPQRATQGFEEPTEANDRHGSEDKAGPKRQSWRLDFFILLARGKRFLLLITGVAAGVSILVALLLPREYVATVILLPPSQNSSIGSAIASQLGNLGGIAQLAAGSSLGLKNPNDMYVAMLQSRTVEDAMVSRFRLTDQYHKKYVSDARKAFENRTTVDGSGKDGLIHISIEDRDPERAAELANGYIDEFRHLSEHLAITEAAQRRLFFERELVAAKDNLAKAEEDMKESEDRTGMIQLNGQAGALIQSAAMLQAQIAAKEVEIGSLQTFAAGQNPQLVQAQQELSSLRAQLAKLGGSESFEGGLIVPKGKVTEAGLEYIRNLRNVKYYETIFEILARQYELAKLDEAKEGAIVQVLDAAVPPEKPSYPRRVWIVVISTALALLAGIVWLMLREGLRAAKSDPFLAGKLAHRNMNSEARL